MRYHIKQTLKCVRPFRKVYLPAVVISPKRPANQLTKKDIHWLLNTCLIIINNNYVMILLDVQIMPRNACTKLKGLHTGQ